MKSAPEGEAKLREEGGSGKIRHQSSLLSNTGVALGGGGGCHCGRGPRQTWGGAGEGADDVTLFGKASVPPV